MIVFAWIVGVISLYLLIGYLFCCWCCYRHGAGYEIPDDEGLRNPQDYIGIYVCLWPIVILTYIVYRTNHIWKTPKIFSKVTPAAFYIKGEIANDADYQAEKHLLGGKK